jgi:hypothetical protein
MVELREEAVSAACLAAGRAKDVPVAALLRAMASRGPRPRRVKRQCLCQPQRAALAGCTSGLRVTLNNAQPRNG